jgi:6-pyruvoyltetrahydropterin/6-carboxytetrahydropterin synthase
MKSSIVRKAQFNAAHRLFIKDKTDQENLEIFGKCAYPNYHGHNYELHVKLSGEIDSETGFVYDIAKLRAIIDEEIIENYDHRNLNLDTEDFKNIIPTVENIAVVIYNRMRKKIENQFEIQIKLYETPRNYTIYPDQNTFL